jgi:hypothetical protein
MVLMMIDAEIKTGFAELDLLAKAEYRQSLAELLQDSDAEHAAVRVGRMIGVLIKQPFARSEDMSQPSSIETCIS